MFAGYLGENLMGYGYGKAGSWVGNLLIIICNWNEQDAGYYRIWDNMG